MAILRVAIAVLDLREGKFHRLRIAMRREEVDDRAAGIAESQQLGDFVEGFAGGVVAGVADVVVRPAAGFAMLGQDTDACGRR